MYRDRAHRPRSLDPTRPSLTDPEDLVRIVTPFEKHPVEWSSSLIDLMVEQRKK